MDHFEYTSDFSLSTDTSIMLFGPVLKELQAPWGIPTLDGEHSHKAGSIHMGQGTTIHVSAGGTL